MTITQTIKLTIESKKQELAASPLAQEVAQLEKALEVLEASGNASERPRMASMNLSDKSAKRLIDFATEALRREDRPMRPAEIFHAIKGMNPRRKVSYQSTYNALVKHDDMVTKAADGTWRLKGSNHTVQ